MNFFVSRTGAGYHGEAVSREIVVLCVRCYRQGVAVREFIAFVDEMASARSSDEIRRASLRALSEPEGGKRIKFWTQCGKPKISSCENCQSPIEMDIPRSKPAYVEVVANRTRELRPPSQQRRSMRANWS
jgi:hypothetical protein